MTEVVLYRQRVERYDSLVCDYVVQDDLTLAKAMFLILNAPTVYSLQGNANM